MKSCNGGSRHTQQLKLKSEVEKKKVRERGSERGEGGFQIAFQIGILLLISLLSSLTTATSVFFFSTCFGLLTVAVAVAGADVVVFAR